MLNKGGIIREPWYYLYALKKLKLFNILSNTILNI
jgi:hypothetical protein